MDFQKLVKARHAVKKFDGKKIPTVDVKQIISTAALAPSGINVQSWHFVIVESDEARKALLEEVNPSNRPQVETAGAVIIIFADMNWKDRLHLIAERAGVEFSDLERERFMERYPAYVGTFSHEYLLEYNALNTGLVTMNLMYAIKDMGYEGNILLGFNRSPRINEVLNVDKRYIPELLITLGSSEDKGEPSFRLPQDDILEIR